MIDHEFKHTDKMRRVILQSDSSILMAMSNFEIPLGFGENTVKEVCDAQNIDTDTFLTVVNFINGNPFEIERVSLPTLMSYLRNAHSYFLELKLPLIRKNLIDSLDYSGGDDFSLVVMRFYDEYVTEVKKHMEHENNTVFTYTDHLLEGHKDSEYNIDSYSKKHSHFEKLKELKDLIIRYYPNKDNSRLYSVLYDIIVCENDLNSHCMIEDELFIPCVKKLESELSTRTSSIEDENQEADIEPGQELLSQREKEIIICVAKGLSNKEIANQLFISVHTVTTHRRNISNKLQIHTSAGLTIYAIANNLVSIDDLKNY